MTTYINHPGSTGAKDCGQHRQAAGATEVATALALRRLVEIVSNYKRPFLLLLLRLHSLLCLIQRSFPFFAGVVLGARLRKDTASNLKVAVGWATVASCIAGTGKLLGFGITDRANEGHGYA